MRRAKAAIPFLLGFILLSSFASISFLRNTEKTCELHISSISSAAESEDYAACSRRLLLLREYWTSRRGIYTLLVHREKIHSVDLTLQEALLFCERADKHGITEKLNIIKTTLSQITESELPFLRNII